MKKAHHVLMLAAENGALAGGKVGGMADVLRDLPGELAPMGVQADIAMPGYGHLPALKDAKLVAELDIEYARTHHRVRLTCLANPSADGAVIYFFCHPLFDGGEIYTYSDSQRPFAEDANKFSLFSLAVAEALRQGHISLPDTFHLHDWHTGFFALLRAFHPQYEVLNQSPCVFTVHNLALQGIRPLQGDPSSLRYWYPQLALTAEQLAKIKDPRYLDCVNPMRAGIVLSERVHLVSPGYTREVLLPSQPDKGFFGGEGLELDMQDKDRNGALFGILNGCNYPDKAKTEQSAPEVLFETLVDILQTRVAQYDEACAVIALENVQGLLQKISAGAAPGMLITSVGRLTDQKVLILRQPHKKSTVLDALLQQLAQQNGILVMLGNGDPEIGEAFARVAKDNANFVFLNFYHESLPELLYRQGDMFLMPSSFEPCGISQMLALQQGQPCLVHGVGGLKDTIVDGETGFVFYGDDLQQQGLSLLKALTEAQTVFQQPSRWKAMCKQARAQRFDWQSSCREYAKQLYHLSA